MGLVNENAPLAQILLSLSPSAEGILEVQGEKPVPADDQSSSAGGVAVVNPWRGIQPCQASLF